MPNALTDRLNTALYGRYRIVRQLGEGGMATVYLCDDLKHDRKVALKLLKPELAAVLGAERFVQEIKTTAALQHPHILPLFDSGTADGFLFYVMPYIEGETLRDRLTRETQLGVDEAVRITRDVADALDYAHRHGVIHRDIKPENILLHDGRPMVADFGIALAVSAAAGGRMTETGLSLGTPHYMSPEQATAQKDITARSDIYSLGSVLYEMLTGQPPHTGASAQQIVMKIIAEPAESVTKYRKSVPPNVAAAVAKAIEKVPADRFESAKAFADALGNPGYTSASYMEAGAGRVGRGVSTRARMSIAAAFVALIGVALWGWMRPREPLPVIRYQLALPSGVSGEYDAPVPVPAPDGSFIVLHGPTAAGGVIRQLWIKRRDRQAATAIAGTDGAEGLALSPAGDWIAFVSGGSLKKVQVIGGAAVTLIDGGVEGMFGLTWLEDGTIVLVRTRNGTPYLAQISSDGGPLADVWKSDSAAGLLPMMVAGTRAVLFDRCLSAASCTLWAVDLRSGKAHVVLPVPAVARYAATGDLVYVNGGRMFAARFDRGAMVIRGEPVPLADSVSPSTLPIELSRSGTLLLRMGGRGGGSDGFEMVWVDRTGRVTPVDTVWHFQVTDFAHDHGWALSPDGTRLAIGLHTEAGDDIWVKQLPHGPLSRVSYDPEPDVRPRWTRDGRAITFFSPRPMAPGIYQHRADGAGKDSLILAGLIDEAAYSPDGAWLILREGGNGSAAGGRDIRGIRRGDTKRVPIVETKFDEEAIAISPDGKWIAYQSDETRTTEVFIRSFPNTDSIKRQVSNGGGAAPLWSRDGHELFYVSAGKDMMSARIVGGASVPIAEPVKLFHVPDDLLTVEYLFYTPWDVAGDGRFIMARRIRGDPAASTVIVAENWLTELKARLKH